jgi:hypothetical protein
MTRDEAFSFLENLRAKKLVVSLLTYHKRYDNLVLSSLAFPRSTPELVLNVNLGFEQIRVVSSTFTNTPIAATIVADKATGNKDIGGQKGTKDTESKPVEKTIQDEIEEANNLPTDTPEQIEHAESVKSELLKKIKATESQHVGGE